MRVEFLSMGLFLGLNGYKLSASQVNATLTMLAVASGDMDEASFAAWLRKNSVQR
jgi:death-on-curing protein